VSTDTAVRETDQAAAVPASPWKSTRVRVVAAILALLVIACGVAATVLGLRWSAASDREDARAAALRAGEGYAMVMFGFDPTTVDANVAKAKAGLVGDARSTYDDIMRSSNLSVQVKQQKVSSTVTIQEAGVSSASADRATVLIFMNQSVSKGDNQLIRVEPSRVQYSMVRSGDRWLIDDITVITDDSLRKKLNIPPSDTASGSTPPASGAVTPPGSSTPAPPAGSSPAPAAPAPAPAG
jgi:Mce-associated membrane protein